MVHAYCSLNPAAPLRTTLAICRGTIRSNSSSGRSSSEFSKREKEDEHQRTGAGAGQEQGLEESFEAGGFLGVVQSSILLLNRLLALAQAAVGVLGRGEGLTPAMGATAAEAAQQADVRRLSRRFLLLLASHLRDSHLLEHCARAAVMAAVGGRAVGAAGGSSASGEAAEGPGQGQAQVEGLERVPSGSGPGILHVLVHDLMFLKNDAKGLAQDCMQAPAPASTLVGPAVLQALSGPAVVHLNLVLGLHTLCTADGGPEYGMPVSYRALPAGWKVERTVDGVNTFAADLQVMGMVDALRWHELREPLFDVLGGAGPMLALLLRVCELLTRSVEVHGQQEEEERGRGQGERGGARTLRHVMPPKAAVDIGYDSHLAAHCLLKECWEQQQHQEQQLQRRAAVHDTGGAGGREAAGAGGSSLPGLQGGEALEAGEPVIDQATGLRSGGRPGAPTADEGPVGTAVDASLLPGGTAGAAALAATADGASEGGVTAELCSREPGGAGGAAEPPAAVQAAGAMPRLDQLAADKRVTGPGLGSRRALSLRALQAFQVRWWRCVCRAAEHVVSLRLGPGEREAATPLERSLAGWLRLDELGLPDPIKDAGCSTSCQAVPGSSS